MHGGCQLRHNRMSESENAAAADTLHNLTQLLGVEETSLGQNSNSLLTGMLRAPPTGWKLKIYSVDPRIAINVAVDIASIQMKIRRQNHFLVWRIVNKKTWRTLQCQTHCNKHSVVAAVTNNMSIARRNLTSRGESPDAFQWSLSEIVCDTRDQNSLF